MILESHAPPQFQRLQQQPPPSQQPPQTMQVTQPSLPSLQSQPTVSFSTLPAQPASEHRLPACAARGLPACGISARKTSPQSAPAPSRFRQTATHLSIAVLLISLFFLIGPIPMAKAASWWDGEWSVRKQITLDLSQSGASITDPIGSATVLIRLHDGNFQFALAKEDGSDIRLVADDGKTLLPYHLEKYDPVLNEAFLWVKLPEIKPGEQTHFWLYYGSHGAKAVSVADAKASYDAETVLVYHFAERNSPPADASGHGHTATSPALNVEGSLISGGARLGGPKPIGLPTSPELSWTAGGQFTWSAWLKATTLAPNAVIYSRSVGGSSFTIGEDNGVAYVEVNGQRSSTGEAVPVNAWHHLAVIANGSQLSVYLNGAKYGELGAPLPLAESAAQLGAETNSFTGEIDELELAKTARPVGWVKLAAATQGGGDKAGKALLLGNDEQTEPWFSGTGHFAIIIKNLTFDGWLVIGVLMIMLVGSWYIMYSKVAYLNSLSKGNEMFMREWQHLATDLTALDNGDAEKARTLGGRATDKKSQRNLRRSSVYRIYHIGSEEIRRRMTASRGHKVLSTRSIQAIRAALDGGMVREKQRIDKLIVLLTICISGGPFLGLLGTVVGVMITFAAVAAAGEVNVNAIAPGIAAALLATVAGLAVAIPALFGYNYILARVKDATADMHVFIDEFVTKMAEFYSEPDPLVPTGKFNRAESRELQAAH